MGAMASQITSLPIVYSTVYSVADQRKHQSSASLALVWGIHRWPLNSPHKWRVTRKMFPFDDVIMPYQWSWRIVVLHSSDWRFHTFVKFLLLNWRIWKSILWLPCCFFTGVKISYLIHFLFNQAYFMFCCGAIDFVNWCCLCKSKLATTIISGGTRDNRFGFVTSLDFHCQT